MPRRRRRARSALRGLARRRRLGVGVFVSFASLLVYTFGIFLKPLAEEFSWSREAVSAAFGIAAMTVAVVLAAARLPARSRRPRRIIVPVPDDLRLRVRVAGAADAAPLAPLRGLRRARHGRQRHGADGVSRAVSSWFERRRGIGAGAGDVRAARSARWCCRRSPQALIRVGAGAAASAALGVMVLAIGLPTVRVHPRAPAHGARPDDAGAPAPRSATGLRSARLLDSGGRAVRQLDRPERRHRAPRRRCSPIAASRPAAARWRSRRWAARASPGGS